MHSLFDIDLSDHLGVGGYLDKLSKLIDWDKIRLTLKGVHGDLGRSGYDVVQMFKCLLLQSWHSLSDPGLEYSLRVRLDFLYFTGFTVGGNLPDETTFCKFRNKLVKQGKYDLLLAEINHQLEAHNIKVSNAEVAIVDATIITSASRPRKVKDIAVNDGESIVDIGQGEESLSSDPDATWKKKGKKVSYGYQSFARCDEEGFIDKTHTTPANKAETKELEIMAQGLVKGIRLNADKGFCSKANTQMLKQKGLKNGILCKAHRNTPLTNWKKKFNSLISKTRWRIEQCFGTIKRRFNYNRASYITTDKVHAQFTLKAICANLLKATNKIILA